MMKNAYSVSLKPYAYTNPNLSWPVKAKGQPEILRFSFTILIYMEVGKID